MRLTEILNKIATQWVPPLLLLLILLAGWEVAGITGYMPKYIAPAPTIILERLFSDYAIIWEHTLWSLQEVAVGYAVGIALGNRLDGIHHRGGCRRNLAGRYLV